VGDLVASEAFLDLADNIRLRKEFVRSPSHVPLRKLDSPLQRLFRCQFWLGHLREDSSGDGRRRSLSDLLDGLLDHREIQDHLGHADL